MLTNNIPYRNFSIDIVGSCNLRCPTCPVGNSRKRTDVRFTKFMQLKLYQKIIDKITNNFVDGPFFDGRIPQISLHDWGEPTLHPLLPEFIDYARNRGLSVGFSSNFNTNPNWEKILQAKPNFIKISLSSLEENNYQVTHRRGKLVKVLGNIENVVRLIKINSPETKLIMNYHVYRHNLKSDFDRVLDFCNSKGIIFSPELAIFMPIEKIVSYRQAHDERGDANINASDKKIISTLLLQPMDQYELWKSNKKIRSKFKECRRQIHKMPIRADGSVPICCGVYDGEFTVSNSFVDEDLESIQNRRESFNYCSTCTSVGAHASYSVGRRGVVMNRLVLRKDFIGRIVRRLLHRELKFREI